MEAALVVAFPIHQGMVAAVAVAPVQVLHGQAIGQAFPASVAEVVLLSWALPSHHPFP